MPAAISSSRFYQYVAQIIQGGEDPEEAKSVIALYLHALASDLAGLEAQRCARRV